MYNRYDSIFPNLRYSYQIELGKLDERTAVLLIKKHTSSPLLSEEGESDWSKFSDSELVPTSSSSEREDDSESFLGFFVFF